MSRMARLVLPEVVHHVVAKGVAGCKIFANDEEKRIYLARFAEIAEKRKVLVHGYCLMDNHVHFILTPTTETGLAKLFQCTHTWWAMRFNRLHKREGDLFQSRYFSSPMGESHRWAALRYVELNPKRAGIVERPEDFEFSSAPAHCSGIQNTTIWLKAMASRRQFLPEEWRAFLRDNCEELDEDLRRALKGNRPVGDEKWIALLEKEAGRPLAWRPTGRPKKSVTAAATQ